MFFRTILKAPLEKTKRKNRKLLEHILKRIIERIVRTENFDRQYDSIH